MSDGQRGSRKGKGRREYIKKEGREGAKACEGVGGCAEIPYISRPYLTTHGRRGQSLALICSPSVRICIQRTSFAGQLYLFVCLNTPVKIVGLTDKVERCRGRSQDRRHPLYGFQSKVSGSFCCVGAPWQDVEPSTTQRFSDYQTLSALNLSTLCLG